MYVGEEGALTADENNKIHDYLHEDDEKFQIKIETERECYFGCGNKVSWFRAPAIITVMKGFEIREPICSRCFELIQLFFRDKRKAEP